MSDFSLSDMLTHLLNQHEKAILYFSGGKDSLAVLNLCKSHLDRILVVHLDTGARLPHMDSFVREAVERVGGNLKIIRPEMPQLDSIRMFGFPIDIAPLRKTIMYKGWVEGCIKIQASFDCCNRLRWAPMGAFVNEYKATLLITGQRKEDPVVTQVSGLVYKGVESFLPIDNWTTNQVMSYLQQNKIPMPPHYPAGTCDCWNCTATDDIDGLMFLKTFYPLQYRKLVADFQTVWGVVKNELNQVEKIWATCEEA